MQPSRKSNFTRRYQPYRPLPGDPEENGEPPSVEVPAEELTPAPDPGSAAENEPAAADPYAESQTPEESALESVVFHRRRRPHVRRTEEWLAVRRALLCFLALLAAGAVGFGLRALTAVPSPVTLLADARTLTPAAEAEVETAYGYLKAGRFVEARSRFLALATGDLAREPRMAFERAAAWCDLAAGNPERAEQTLETQAHRGDGAADTDFLLGLTHLRQGSLSEAEESFTRAAALDPTRADTFFLWGDVLRRKGRPRESIEKFQSALRRNRQETNVSLYQLKLWLSQLQSGDPEAAEAGAAVDAALENSAPSSSALLAAAAREFGAARPAGAADYLRRARPVTDPVVWTLIMLDPVFAQEAWRPELAEFFAPSDPGPETPAGRP